MLEIGEEVVIRPDIDLESGLGIVRQMARYAGQTVTIRSNQYSEIFKCPLYTIEEDDGVLVWVEEAFLPKERDLESMADEDFARCIYDI